MNELFKSVRYLKGVGEKKAAYYEKLGISTVYLIFFIIFRAVMLIFQIPYLLLKLI